MTGKATSSGKIGSTGVSHPVRVQYSSDAQRAAQEGIAQERLAQERIAQERIAQEGIAQERIAQEKPRKK